MALNSIFDTNSIAAQKRWVKGTAKTLEKEHKIDIHSAPVSIFHVPKTVSAFKPEAYAPQLIALGPYHHLEPELYKMQVCKLAAAGRVQRECKFKSVDIKHLVQDELMKLEPRIRAAYHNYLDLEGETLAWIMAIDGLFLLELLHNIYLQDDTSQGTSRRVVPWLFDSVGRKLPYDAILRDAVMLENQIPIFLLTKILKIHCSEIGQSLPSMLKRFCTAVSPLALTVVITDSEVNEREHLLDLLHHWIVRKPPGGAQNPSNVEAKVYYPCPDITSDQDSKMPSKSRILANVTFLRKLKQFLQKARSVFSKVPGIPNYPCLDITSDDQCCKMLLKFNNVPFLRKPQRFLVKAWGIFSKVPWIPNLAQICNNPTNADSSSKVEEIRIPSVSELHEAGVKFCVTDGGIYSVNFDKKTLTLKLPVITLDMNSEVVVRNLVAYEASAIPGPPVFTGYMELMCGIVDTAKDVEILQKRGIVKNRRLPSSKEVAQLFNGINKSNRLKKVQNIDEAIDGVNKHFNNTPKVKARKCLKMYVYSSWKLLTFVAAILVLLLMALQSFCSVYYCPRILAVAAAQINVTTTD